MKLMTAALWVVLLGVGVRTGRSELRFSSLSFSNGFNAVLSVPLDSGFVVQRSTDLQSWALVTNIASARSGSFLLIDSLVASPRQYYRAKRLFPDLGASTNEIFFGKNDGLNLLQFDPAGRLAMLLYRNGDLIYRWQDTDDLWTEEVICDCGSVFVPSAYEAERASPFAALLFDSGGRPHVFQGYRPVTHFTRGAAGWQVLGQISGGKGSVQMGVAAIGPGDKFHLAFAAASSGFGLGEVWHASNREGGWSWTTVKESLGDPRGFYHQAYSPRYFAMAVDSRGAAHIVYTPQFSDIPFGGGTMSARSEMHYATESLFGGWSTERVAGPLDDSADAGLGAHLAISPDDQPEIVSWYDERAQTGSAQFSRLTHWQRAPTGAWAGTPVTSASDGYAAGDGPLGTGFAPFLFYDVAGRAHVVFSDHSAQHFSSGQDEFAGQIRHAMRTGTAWTVETIFRQDNPLLNQVAYPVAAMSGDRLAVMALRRKDTLSPLFTVERSDYQLLTLALTVPLPPGCHVRITPGILREEASATNRTLSVRASPAGCAWPVSSAHAWLVPQVQQGSGDRTLGLGILANQSAERRTGTVAVASQRLTVIQEPGCTLRAELDTYEFAGTAGAGTITVEAKASCEWNLSSSVPWIKLDRTSGSGAGSIRYTLGENPGLFTRMGWIMAGEEPLGIIQHNRPQGGLLAPPWLVGAVLLMTDPAGFVWRPELAFAADGTFRGEGRHGTYIYIRQSATTARLWVAYLNSPGDNDEITFTFSTTDPGTGGEFTARSVESGATSETQGHFYLFEQ